MNPRWLSFVRHTDDKGNGLFDILGLPSAEFIAWESLPLEPGMEAAQIDWDGVTAHVDWVEIEDIITESGTPGLELGSYLEPGASGGGVYWNGYHIANNWSRLRDRDKNSGKIVRQYGKVAFELPASSDARSGTRSGVSICKEIQ